MDYSKCWLDYQPVDTVEKEWLTYFQSCEGEIIESAVSEYKLAMENMAGKVPQRRVDCYMVCSIFFV